MPTPLFQTLASRTGEDLSFCCCKPPDVIWTSTLGNSGLNVYQEENREMRQNTNRDSNGTTIDDGNVGGPLVEAPSEFPEDAGDGCLDLPDSKCEGLKLGMTLLCWKTRKSVATGGGGESGKEMLIQEGPRACRAL